MSSKSSLVIPIVLSVIIHAVIISAGEVVRRRTAEDRPRSFEVEYTARQPDRKKVPSYGSEGKKMVSQAGGTSGNSNSLETPDPVCRPYFEKIRRGIDDRWEEPRLSPDDPTKGTLVVEFTLGREGELRAVAVARSSGERGLDFAAVRAVKLSAPFEAFTPEITSREIAVRALFVHD